MEKSEKLILQAFTFMRTPDDFYRDVQNITLVDSLCGLVSRAKEGERISKNEIDLYNFDLETKQRISKFVSKCDDNLIYYELMKCCFVIMYKYSV